MPAVMIIIVILANVLFFTIFYYVIRAAVLSAAREALHLQEPSNRERNARAKEVINENKEFFAEVLGSTIKKAIAEALQENEEIQNDT